MLEEVILSDKTMLDKYLYSFLQLFFHTEKISLHWRLDITVTDYVLLIYIVIPLWQIMSLLKQLSTQHKIGKRIM